VESDKCDGISLDALIVVAVRALAAGDPLAALKRVAQRDDPSDQRSCCAALRWRSSAT
jgi:hypothetical protein